MDADEPSPAADWDADSQPTVAEAVVDAMLDRGVDTVFGIPGKQTLPLNRALADRDARFVVARHETAVPHQAWGYAETSEPGAMAATCVVPGPGDTNAMNGLKNALNDCVPLLHLAVETERSVRGGDGIHETPPETYDTVVKENVLVDSYAGAVPAVVEAIQEQAARLTYVQASYPVEVRTELYGRLATVAPGDLSNVWLCNSGTEANEA
ncbi:MAG: thiamine pyrophosphate-binding protein, partial [Halorubrum sp.]